MCSCIPDLTIVADDSEETVFSNIKVQLLKNVLDLGCGPGGWALDVAFELLETEVEGVDISRPMVNYANARAISQRLKNVSFGVMSITEVLDIPSDSYDLVNARFLAAVLKREAWSPFLHECTRILRPGGYLRLTEGSDFGITNSQAVNGIMNLMLLS
jgi:ubiquinone/menaquinone biosynthesis C-methylase UbiE